MSHVKVDVGFVPLVDAAPLIVAREIGFAAEEGLDLVLHREGSWATQRDRLAWGQYQAAHMVAPMCIALSAGLGGLNVAIDALCVLSVNGNMIGVRPDVADAMGAVDLDFQDARAVGRRLAKTVRGPLRFGVPYPFSMHALLVSYWLENLGPDCRPEYQLVVVPPPQMADAIAHGDIDAFCVGEPYGSVAVERGYASLILPSAAIWQFAPEKTLSVRRDWLEEEPKTASALLRAIWRASQWIAKPENTGTTSELLALERYLNVPPEILERVLTGRIVTDGHGRTERVQRAAAYFEAAATFPWRSQALWIAEALARQTGTDPARLRDVARDCFRSDFYRTALEPIGADLPGASEKLEGSLDQRTAVASTQGRLILGPDRFFDGRTFDPDDPPSP
ncbi:CmpA/NrtA family ABC transporter substrate-binding protein [Amaricoccus macauensis]|uniref:CmpA/NrtA family ABC transporter substrate-binding protein n=1 Tax=Amaricoccus macauensis TaxID=57001 RepID=UPI003C797184